MNFKTYYSSIIRFPTRSQPKADEAMRDYKEAMRHISVIALY